jgi:hypothetical protein
MQCDVSVTLSIFHENFFIHKDHIVEWVWWVADNSFSSLCELLLWDFPDHRLLLEGECGEQPVTLSTVYVKRHCEFSQIIRPYLKVSVVSER